MLATGGVSTRQRADGTRGQPLAERALPFRDREGGASPARVLSSSHARSAPDIDESAAPDPGTRDPEPARIELGLAFPHRAPTPASRLIAAAGSTRSLDTS